VVQVLVLFVFDLLLRRFERLLLLALDLLRDLTEQLPVQVILPPRGTARCKARRWSRRFAWGCSLCYFFALGPFV
jgi:hypothetical protein